MKLTLDLPTSQSLAIRRRANMRGLSAEEAVIELLETALQATGELDGQIADRPPLRLVRSEGTA